MYDDVLPRMYEAIWGSGVCPPGVYRRCSCQVLIRGLRLLPSTFQGSTKKYFLDVMPISFEDLTGTSPHLDHLRKYLMVAKILRDGRENHTYGA